MPNVLLVQICKNTAGKRLLDMSCSRMSVDGAYSPAFDCSMSFTSPLASEYISKADSLLIAYRFADKSHVDSSLIKTTIDRTTVTKRRHVCLELLDTERNYLNILKAIVAVFEEPLRQMLKISEEQQKMSDIDAQKNNSPACLDKTEIDTIFGNVGPLVRVHEKIYAELVNLIETNWTENSQIGKVFVTHVSLDFYCDPS